MGKISAAHLRIISRHSGTMESCRALTIQIRLSMSEMRPVHIVGQYTPHPLLGICSFPQKICMFFASPFRPISSNLQPLLCSSCLQRCWRKPQTPTASSTPIRTISRPSRRTDLRRRPPLREHRHQGPILAARRRPRNRPHPAHATWSPINTSPKASPTGGTP